LSPNAVRAKKWAENIRASLPGPVVGARPRMRRARNKNPLRRHDPSRVRSGDLRENAQLRYGSQMPLDSEKFRGGV
jgi:hypothetical protein